MTLIQQEISGLSHAGDIMRIKNERSIRHLKGNKFIEKAPGEDAGDFSSAAESVGFEPTCPVKDNRISSAARYDHFDNSPKLVLFYYKARDLFRQLFS